MNPDTDLIGSGATRAPLPEDRLEAALVAVAVAGIGLLMLGAAVVYLLTS